MSDADIIDASFTEFDAITDTVDGKENTFIASFLVTQY